VKNFVPETFWGIKLSHQREGKTVNFAWTRGSLFDRMSVIILYERCLVAKTAKVTKVQQKPTSKWKPLPLTTLEFQKMATKYLRMSGHEAMETAEKLYQKGFISYPRTETDQFDKEINLRALVRKQEQDRQWGEFATNLGDGAFQQPRNGRHNDKAHPPIHPVTYAANLEGNERRVYEFIVRRFLACCSQDAKGMATDVEIAYGDEMFTTRGLRVVERNYLDVYPYENWTGTAELPNFTIGERFEPTEALISEGKTSAPSYLTEADLLALMDANGIGTDATMAEHIKKIQVREYVVTRQRGAAGGAYEGADGDEPQANPPARGRGSRGGTRGRGGGRGRARAEGGSRGGVTEFIPTSLGVALIQGFDRMNFETSLGKPFLRKEMELKTKAICAGRMTPQAVLRESLSKYREVYEQSQGQLNVLKNVRLACLFPLPYACSLLMGLVQNE
jgi:DNA topoisomerase-3